MDEGILVEVFLPAVQQHRLLILPSAYTMKQIKEVLFLMLEESTQGAIQLHEDSVLYLVETQVNLMDTQTVCEIGLQHADELIIW